MIRTHAVGFTPTARTQFSDRSTRLDSLMTLNLLAHARTSPQKPSRDIVLREAQPISITNLISSHVKIMTKTYLSLTFSLDIFQVGFPAPQTCRKPSAIAKKWKLFSSSTFLNSLRLAKRPYPLSLKSTFLWLLSCVSMQIYYWVRRKTAAWR